MASRSEIIRASNSDGPAPLSACLSAAIAPVATSISPATMIPLNIVHPDDGSRRAAGERFEVSHKTKGPSEMVAWAEKVLPRRSEEHTSELQSHMRLSNDVFCLKT